MLAAFFVWLRQDRCDRSKVRSTCAEERASLSGSKLACASADHAKRAVGLPTCAKRRERRRHLGIALQEVAVVIRKPSKAAYLCARRRRCPLYYGLHLVWVNGHAILEESVAQKADLLWLLPELALGALGIELPTTEDLEHFLNVEQVLLQRQRVHQAVVHVHLPSVPDAPGTCRPKGTAFHSNWPSCDRKLVFHLSEAR